MENIYIMTFKCENSKDKALDFYKNYTKEEKRKLINSDNFYLVSHLIKKEVNKKVSFSFVSNNPKLKFIQDEYDENYFRCYCVVEPLYFNRFLEFKGMGFISCDINRAIRYYLTHILK